MRQGANMKQIRIILKNGKEIQWETDSDPIVGIMHAEGSGYTTAADGRGIHITEDEVAATVITPMVKCPYCGEWMIPNKNIVTHYTNDGHIKDAEVCCSECGHALSNIDLASNDAELLYAVDKIAQQEISCHA